MRVALTFGILFALTACAAEPPANELRAAGHVEATEVRLAPDSGGRIVELAVKEGDTVQTGALILRLDPRTPSLALDRARAEQRHAEAQLQLLQAGARRRGGRSRGTDFGRGRSRALRGAARRQRRLAQAAR
jgi:HlyD family secretion protein